MRKLGLALGAGGSRGAAHIGFLKALEEEQIKPSFVTGCSMGAIIGACFCAGVSPDTLKEVVLSLKLSRIAALNVTPLKSNGLFRFTKARKLLVEYVGEKTFSELNIPFACVATDLVHGKTITLRKGNVVDAALASSSIPGAFTPAVIRGKTLVDGGILERVPTLPLRRMGADVVVAVDVLGDLTEKEISKNPIETLLRCIDIMDTRATLRKKNGRKKSVDLWLTPDLGGMDQYKVKKLDFAFEKGYELGKENAGKIRALMEA